MKKLLLSFLLLMSSAFAQNRYSSFGAVENPAYGLTAQLFNGGTNTIYLDYIGVSGVPVPPLPHGSNAVYSISWLYFGFGLAHAEQSACTPFEAIVMGGNSKVLAPADIRVSGQPCFPNGLPYGMCLSQCGTTNAVYNYTDTNFAALEICSSQHCWTDLTSASIALAPGTGVTIFTSVYDGKNGFSWQGYAYVNFRWHDHSDCPAQSTDPLCVR